jgi:tRNA(adenine34) deaminase
MCAGAAHAARVSRLVYATHDPKAGYAGTLHNTPTDTRLNHTFPVEGGLLATEAADLLRAFFKNRRPKPPKTAENRTSKDQPEPGKAL